MIIISWDIGVKNLAYFIVNFDNNKISVLSWNNFNILYNKIHNCSHCLSKHNSNSKKISIYDIKLHVLYFLNNTPILSNVDSVVIENQPGLKNPRMKVIAETIYNWYFFKHFDKLNITFFINYVSPSKKIYAFLPNIKQFFKNHNLSSGDKKKIFKNSSIYICRQIFKYCPHYLSYIDTFIKKDDICDTVLLCLSYLLLEKKISFNSIMSLFTYNVCLV